MTEAVFWQSISNTGQTIEQCFIPFACKKHLQNVPSLLFLFKMWHWNLKGTHWLGTCERKMMKGNWSLEKANFHFLVLELIRQCEHHCSNILWSSVHTFSWCDNYFFLSGQMTTNLFISAYMTTEHFMKLSMDNYFHWERAGSNSLSFMH